MQKRIVNENAEKRLLSVAEAAQYIGQGETRTRSYMEEIGAVRKMGRRVLFDRAVIDRALDELAEQVN